MGFMAVERLAQRAGAGAAGSGSGWRDERKFNARLVQAALAGTPALLCEPMTFMNLSGEAIGEIARFYRIEPGNILVIVDDADLEWRCIRLRGNGSSGGHHGLESVEVHLATRDYARQKIGIGRRDPKDRQIVGHVLGKLSAAEEADLDAILDRACEQIECWAKDGLTRAMNQFNGVVKP